MLPLQVLEKKFGIFSVNRDYNTLKEAAETKYKLSA